MKELYEIVKAFEEAEKRRLKTVLATVVQVVGSAYRHEGARMLICENGELTGAISGGCLEGDALRKARLAMTENRKMLVTYDTTDEDDAVLGVGLGCNGIIHVLLEPLDAKSRLNPINLFKRFLEKRQNAVLGTFFTLENKLSPQPGTCILVTESGNITGELSERAFQQNFIADAGDILERGESIIRDYTGITGLKGFVEYLKPAVHLLIFGAGNDAVPLVQFASVLGWEVSVIDGRPNYASPARFPSANTVLVAKPETALAGLSVDDRTVSVLMTHNYNYDIQVLKELQKINLKYIGVLGPKKKLQRMLDDLAEEGIQVTKEKLNSIFGPTGLDIGSETPEEIALSILAEIKAVLSNREGTSLKYRPAEHNDAVPVSKKHANAKFSSCAINL